MSNQAPWKVRIHTEFDYTGFLNALGANQAALLASFLAKVLQLPKLTDAPRSWVKPLGDGLFEFRIRASNVLVRIFFTYQENRVILLLAGYDKQSEPSKTRQQREISIARKRMGNV